MSKSTSTVKVIQFSGTYLNKQWTRRFILGTLLQRYDPSKLREGSTINQKNNSVSQEKKGGHHLTDAALLRVQRLASETWQLPTKPLDPVSESRIFRLLARYACGEGALSDEAFAELKWVLRALPGAPVNIEDPRQMEQLLEALHFVERGDNIRRLSYAGTLHYPPQAHSLMTPHLTERIQRDGGDPFDPIREVCDGPAYAIDSATTSEVDDAIGLELDPVTGEEFFTVYVSDATVYCPYDSALEQITARLLTTTTYLPEGVYFMLPKPIVEAATLREDRPCRTFNIRFQIHPTTGELYNYSVHVGWLKQLRRITYDQVQVLLTPPQGAGTRADTPAQPMWMQRQDEQRIKRIYEVAKLRFNSRMQRSDAQGRAVEANLPEPLIKVDGTRVVSVTDQIISTQDARLAVAELMIAANEVCSRVGQANGIALPYRGTRSLSTDHQVAKYFAEPQGVTTAASLDRGFRFMAEAIVQTVRQLSAVTRAIYQHAPLYHAGLDTTHYTHSTSPLRRYADMLVHHQLKVLLWEQHKSAKGKRQTFMTDDYALPRSLFALPPIAEHTMASLCQMISNKQQLSSLLQDNSSRFWILRFMADLLARDPQRLFVCLVGETRRVSASPTYRASSSSSVPEVLAALQPPEQRANSNSGRDASTTYYEYVSDMYIPELQFAHTVQHNNPEVRVGAVVDCEVTTVMPTQGLLEMQVVTVRSGIDERQGERLWMGSAVSVLDA